MLILLKRLYLIQPDYFLKCNKNSSSCSSYRLFEICFVGILHIRNLQIVLLVSLSGHRSQVTQLPSGFTCKGNLDFSSSFCHLPGKQSSSLTWKDCHEPCEQVSTRPFLQGAFIGFLKSFWWHQESRHISLVVILQSKVWLVKPQLESGFMCPIIKRIGSYWIYAILSWK